MSIKELVDQTPSRLANHILKHAQTCQKCQVCLFQLLEHLFKEEKDWQKDFLKLVEDLK